MDSKEVIGKTIADIREEAGDVTFVCTDDTEIKMTSPYSPSGVQMCVEGPVIEGDFEEVPVE